MSQLQNEIRDVNVHQREEEGVWKPEGRSIMMNAEMKTGVNILSFFGIQRTNTNLGCPLIWSLIMVT